MAANGYHDGSDSRNNNRNSQSRQRRNKYKKYSKAPDLDPIDKVIERVKEERKNATFDSSAPVRGTTVPTITASPRISKMIINRTIIHADRVVPSDPWTFGYIQIGDISGPHGVKGELKVYFDSDFIEDRICPGAILYVRKPNRRSPRPVKVTSIRQQLKNIYLVKFQHINSRLGAAAFKQYSLYAKLDDRPPLRDNEYLIRDLVGMECYLNETIENSEDQKLSINSNPIAIVSGVVPPEELCSQEVAHLMHAQLELQLIDSSRRCLVPLVPNIVISVDISSRRLYLDPPTGLLDNTYEATARKIVIKGYLPASIDRLSDKERSIINSFMSIQSFSIS